MRLCLFVFEFFFFSFSDLVWFGFAFAHTHNITSIDTFITRIFTADHFESVFSGINIGSVCQPHNHKSDSLTHSLMIGNIEPPVSGGTYIYIQPTNSTNEQISFQKMVNKLLVIRIFVYLFESIISFSQVLLVRSFIHSFVCSYVVMPVLYNEQTRAHNFSFCILYCSPSHFEQSKDFSIPNFHRFILYYTVLLPHSIDRSIFSLFFLRKLFSS